MYHLLHPGAAPAPPPEPQPRRRPARRPPCHLGLTLTRFGLYAILSSPISYGSRRTKEGSVRGRILANGRAIVLQSSRLCKRGGGIHG